MKLLQLVTTRGTRKFRVESLTPNFTQIDANSTTEIYDRPGDNLLLKVTMGGKIFAECGDRIGSLRQILVDNALAFGDIPKSAVNAAKPEILAAVQAYRTAQAEGELIE